MLSLVALATFPAMAQNIVLVGIPAGQNEASAIEVEVKAFLSEDLSKHPSAKARSAQEVMEMVAAHMPFDGCIGVSYGAAMEVMEGLYCSENGPNAASDQVWSAIQPLVSEYDYTPLVSGGGGTSGGGSLFSPDQAEKELLTAREHEEAMQKAWHDAWADAAANDWDEKSSKAFEAASSDLDAARINTRAWEDIYEDAAGKPYDDQSPGAQTDLQDPMADPDIAGDCVDVPTAEDMPESPSYTDPAPTDGGDVWAACTTSGDLLAYLTECTGDMAANPGETGNSVCDLFDGSSFQVVWGFPRLKNDLTIDPMPDIGLRDLDPKVHDALIVVTKEHLP